MPPHPTAEEADRAAAALATLASPEQLTWHANAAHDSLANTTLRFERAFYGLPRRPPILTDAAVGERVPSAVQREIDALLAAQRRLQAERAEGSGAGGAGGDGAARTPEQRRQQQQQHESATRSHSGAAGGGSSSSGAGGSGERRTSTAAGAEQASPSSARSRRARSERSSGGSQTAGAKKRVRKSLGEA